MDRKGSVWNLGVVPSIISNQLLRWQSRQSNMAASGTPKTKPFRQGMLITRLAGLGGLGVSALTGHLMNSLKKVAQIHHG